MRPNYEGRKICSLKLRYQPFLLWVLSVNVEIIGEIADIETIAMGGGIHDIMRIKYQWRAKGSKGQLKNGSIRLAEIMVKAHVGKGNKIKLD